MSMVSIVMSAYNGENYISEQIDSILESTYQDFDLYICDDGSKDGTMDLLQQYHSKHPDRIHIFQNEVNLGYTLNFLQGVCRTTADYIMFCDQDDVWKPNKIADTLNRMRMLEAQRSKELPLAVFTDATVVDSKLNKLKESFFKSSRLNPGKTDLPHILMENKLIGCTVMINAALRQVLRSHRMPIKARYHDWWIALIAASCGKICFLPEQTMLYRQHSHNAVGNQSFFTYIRNRVSTLKGQKEALLALEKQAEEYLELYKELLSEEATTVISRFAQLHHYNFIKKRRYLIHYGYLKTGLIRNIGLMFII
ncbi:MAG TPA: glycosyltransferase family 2 protein [Mobilitalea sp.]|nr:glycosyltransferase family 2 protein [Mobilitalea sp.]